MRLVHSSRDDHGADPGDALEAGLAAFLDEHLSDEDHDVARIELRQQTVQGDRPVSRWNVDEGADVGGIAARVMIAAHRDSQAFRGDVLYAACLVRASDKLGGYSASFPFRLRGLPVEPPRPAGYAPGYGPLGESEPATDAGMTAQLMRHNEAYARMMLSLSAERASEHRRELERRDLRTERLERIVEQLYEARETLLDRSADRQLEQLKAANAEERKNMIAGRAAKLLPVVANRLLSGFLSKGTPKAFLGRELLQNLFGTITPEQMQKLFEAQILDPSQIALLIELHSTIADDAAKEGDGSVEDEKGAPANEQ